ncbi:hypothetical protein FRC09_013047 [Ceratobasidium sp. 395]|nr:hypothetical protein FRC09_013047 [Ceratobasidium sp. 395]
MVLGGGGIDLLSRWYIYFDPHATEKYLHIQSTSGILLVSGFYVITAAMCFTGLRGLLKRAREPIATYRTFSFVRLAVVVGWTVFSLLWTEEEDREEFGRKCKAQLAKQANGGVGHSELDLDSLCGFALLLAKVGLIVACVVEISKLKFELRLHVDLCIVVSRYVSQLDDADLGYRRLDLEGDTSLVDGPAHVEEVKSSSDNDVSRA